MIKTSIKILCCILIFSTVCCQSINSTFNLEQHKIASPNLGDVGISKDFLFNSSFKNNAVITLDHPIKLSTQSGYFTKSGYKAYLRAKATNTSTNVEVVFNDSLSIKPQYMVFNIIDKLSIIDALNNSDNASLKELLSLQNQSDIITSISAAISQQQMQQLAKADEVFLVANGVKSFALQLYINNQPKELIKFKDIVIFNYKSSCVCWKEDSKYQLNIVDLVEGNNCPNGSKKSSKQAEKRMDYFKF